MLVSLARVEARAVLGLGANAQVHLRVGLVVVQDHHVLVVGELAPSEFPGCPVEQVRVGAAWHRQHHVERLPARAHVGDQGASEPPVLRQLADRFLAAADIALVVLNLNAAMLADVTEVRRDGLHSAPAASHLDHHLGCAAHHGGLDACADDRCTVPAWQRAELRLRLGLDDAVARIEQAIAPLNQHAVDVMRFGHGRLLQGHMSRLAPGPALAWTWRGGRNSASTPDARRRCTRTWSSNVTSIWRYSRAACT